MQCIAEQVQKLSNTERFFLKDSPGDNIQSEETAKKILEAGNVIVFIHTCKWDSKFCPCGGKLNMSDDVYVCMQQESKKLIVNAYMTYQKKRGAKHVVQSWQQYHFEAKEFTRKITHKGKYMSIFDHFQKDYVFMQASDNMIGQTNGAKNYVM